MDTQNLIFNLIELQGHIQLDQEENTAIVEVMEGVRSRIVESIDLKLI